VKAKVISIDTPLSGAMKAKIVDEFGALEPYVRRHAVLKTQIANWYAKAPADESFTATPPRFQRAPTSAKSPASTNSANAWEPKNSWRIRSFRLARSTPAFLKTNAISM
jgi:hypothetical protein